MKRLLFGAPLSISHAPHHAGSVGLRASAISHRAQAVFRTFFPIVRDLYQL